MKALTKEEVLRDHESHNVTLDPTMRKAAGEHSRQRNSKCQGPEVGMSWACSGNGRKVPWLG